MLALAAGVVALLTSALCPAEDAGKPFLHSIRPRGIAEQCFNLASGATVGYAFEASAPVDFNVHFHRGKDVEYPVQRTDVRAADERFTASSTEEFCLMWTNRGAAVVTVTGRLGP